MREDLGGTTLRLPPSPPRPSRLQEAPGGARPSPSAQDGPLRPSLCQLQSLHHFQLQLEICQENGLMRMRQI